MTASRMPGGRLPTEPQPMPKLDESATRPKASVQELVRRDLTAREQVGIERYKMALYPHNGRDALRDAYEEALDLACYLKQALLERDGGAA